MAEKVEAITRRKSNEGCVLVTADGSEELVVNEANYITTVLHPEIIANFTNVTVDFDVED